MSSATTTSAQILHHTTTFLSETVTQPDLRRHLSSTFLKTLPTNLINPLNFALQTIEKAISTTTSPTLRSSSIRLAENLLHSNPQTTFSSFLLSLVYYLSHRLVDASLSLLHAFQSDPPFSRLEMAPFLFQDLFLIHFSPILDWYNAQRHAILSSSCNASYDSDRDDGSVVLTTTTVVLSKMSGDQALALKGLEKDYEDLLDENCRLFVAYFMEVLQNKDGDKMIIDPPIIVLVLHKSYCESGDDDREKESDLDMMGQGFGSIDRRYNPMWDEESVELKKHNKVQRFPSFFPVRVSPKVVTNQELETSPDNNLMDYSFQTHVQKENIKKASSLTMEHVNGGSKPAVATVSPKSVITIDGAMTELRVAINEVCTSEILREAELGVLKIERLWKVEPNREVEIMLSKPPVINGFMEILFNSMDSQVLTATVFLLTELGSRDEGVVQALTRVDSDVECVVQLFKKGLREAVVLLHLLKPSGLGLVEMELVDCLLELLSSEEGGVVRMFMEPKTAALLLLSRIVQSYEEESVVEIVESIVSSRAIERIMVSLRGEEIEERVGAVSILLRCILEDGKCRNVIVEKVELGPLLEIFLVVSDGERFEIVHFLSELVKLNRRSLNEKILHVLKEEGTFSTMHTLLLYLQNVSVDQSPIVAGLLLQLDLLDEPRKMSIYREEAMDTLISCLRNSESPVAQICAAETLLSLQGSFSYSGKSLSRAILLKRAGFDRIYKSFMRKDQRRHNLSAEPQHNTEDEKSAEEWERKVSFVIVSHEFGLVFEALAEGLKSNLEELQSVCFMIAAWLVYMLSILPDTGIRGAARVCLLHHFISVFKTDNNIDERALSMLGLNTFIRDPEGVQDLSGHMKDILKGLRDIKKSSAMAFEMLKVLSEEHENSADLWNHKELSQEDCSINGEVVTLACFKGKIFSGHSDGTINVWIIGEEDELQLIQQVHEHTKAVTSLAVLHSSDKLYSGSLDRTVKVWRVREEGIYCEQVEEMKDQINNLVVANSIACYIPQGSAGIKVHSWNGASKVVNQHKYAKCLALVQGKLYSGCQDNSIQEIDLATGTVGNIKSGSKKLLAKANPIYALQVHEGLLYAGGDGPNVKIWSTSNYGLIGSLQSTLDVRTMAVSSELVYLGCKSGSIEVWCKNKHTRVETLHTSSNAKIVCMAFDSNQDILLVGTSHGTIQTWGLN